MLDSNNKVRGHLTDKMDLFIQNGDHLHTYKHYNCPSSNLIQIYEYAVAVLATHTYLQYYLFIYLYCVNETISPKEKFIILFPVYIYRQLLIYI